MFKLAHALEVEASHVGAQNRKFGLKEDQPLADMGERLTLLQRKGAEAKTDADRQANVEAGQADITASENAGYGLACTSPGWFHLIMFDGSPYDVYGTAGEMGKAAC